MAGFLKTSKILKVSGIWIFLLTSAAVLIFHLIPDDAFSADKKIRIGGFHYHPVLFNDANGQTEGFYKDLFSEIARNEGWHLEYVNVSWNDGLDLIKKGEIDVLTSVAKTEERELFMDFCSTNVLTVWGEVYAGESSGLDSILNLENRKIAVMKDDINGNNFRKLADSFGIQCIYEEAPDFRAVFEMIADSRVDAGVVNSAFGMGNSRNFRIKSTGIVFNPFKIYFTTAKNRNRDILETLDRYLEKWKHDQDSPYQSSMKKWFYNDGHLSSIIPQWIYPAFAVLLFGVFSVLFFNYALRRKVRSATSEILASNARLMESEARMSEFMRHVPALILIKDSELRPVYANEKFREYFPFDEWKGKKPDELFDVHIADLMIHKDMNAFENGYSSYEEEWTDIHGDSHVFLTTKFRIDIPDSDPMLGVIISDITEKKRAETELHEMNEIFRLFMENNPIYVFIKDDRIRPVYLSRTFEKMLGIPIENAIGKTMEELFPPGLARSIVDADTKILNDGVMIEIEEELAGRTYSTIKFPIMINGTPKYLAGYTIDITEKRNAEQEKERLYTQLLHSQKMESIGRLAGGVAHDFNNMLQAIIGFSDIAMMMAGDNENLGNYLKEIQKAAKRSADLTKQLLAFARKQTVMPRILDLNDIVASMLRMLERMIGEDIALAWLPGNSLWKIRMDSTQIDQVLTNLAVNARDAIRGGGTITIKTENTELDPIYCMKHAGAIPGEYVMLSISDDGCGMEGDILNRIFEPFFTTKDVGEGSGLGLATVYGIVKQNSGFIDVTSSPGTGTTFSVYIPRYAESITEEDSDDVQTEVSRGSETILIVEDEQILLNLGKAVLKHHGYMVLDAPSPNDAIRLVNEYQEQIDLLITDVVMPEMNGRELAEIIVGINPGIKCLFMSGYATDMITNRGALPEGTHFIQKPFSTRELAVKVREILENRD